MTKSKSTVPALNTKKDIPTFLKLVEAKIEALTKDMPKSPKTTGDLSGFGKISAIKTVHELIRANAVITLKDKIYTDSAKTLGVDVKKYPCKIDGSAASSWRTDIKSRMTSLVHKDELEKLNKIKTKLEENLSAKEKWQRDMADIEAIILE